MKLHELVDLEIDTETEFDTDSQDQSEQPSYDDVFKAIANHFGIEPEEIDDQDEQKREEIYDMMDQCWDSEEDCVTDSCPVDITDEHEEDAESDQDKEDDQQQTDQYISFDTDARQ